MTIKAGDKMPAGKRWELPVEWFAGCPTAADEITLPDAFDVSGADNMPGRAAGFKTTDQGAAGKSDAGTHY